jgi:hypothetical protein
VLPVLEAVVAAEPADGLALSVKKHKAGVLPDVLAELLQFAVDAPLAERRLE